MENTLGDNMRQAHTLLAEASTQVLQYAGEHVTDQAGEFRRALNVTIALSNAIRELRTAQDAWYAEAK